jgi:hypothetical protein
VTTRGRESMTELAGTMSPKRNRVVSSKRYFQVSARRCNLRNYIVRGQEADAGLKRCPVDRKS